MTYRATPILNCVAVLLAFVAVQCNRNAPAGLKGQSNMDMVFYGKAVDQDGQPLSGASFEFRVEAFPKDWTYETRARPSDVVTVQAVSDQNGLFQLKLTGHRLTRLKADRDGYRHYFEKDLQDGTPQTSGYTLIAWGDPCFKSDSDHPAVFVFVKNGQHDVSSLPCRGGYMVVATTQLHLNEPTRPKIPSLDDVTYKPPATQTTTRGS